MYEVRDRGRGDGIGTRWGNVVAGVGERCRWEGLEGWKSRSPWRHGRNVGPSVVVVHDRDGGEGNEKDQRVSAPAAANAPGVPCGHHGGK